MIKEIDRRYRKLKSQMQLRFTIASVNDETLAFWEPKAPRFGERLESLRYAFRRGYRTSVSVEPFLDHGVGRECFSSCHRIDLDW